MIPIIVAALGVAALAGPGRATLAEEPVPARAILGQHRLLNAAGADVGQLAVWDAPPATVAGGQIPAVRLFAWVRTCLRNGEPEAGDEVAGTVIDRGAGRYDLAAGDRTVMTVEWRASGSTWSARGTQGTIATGGEIALAACS
jgi:hypothetical protein